VKIGKAKKRVFLAGRTLLRFFIVVEQSQFVNNKTQYSTINIQYSIFKVGTQFRQHIDPFSHLLISTLAN
jgi:hypothetical protein